MTEEEERQFLSDMQAVKQCLLGYNGQNGLVKQVSKNTKKIFWLCMFVVALTGGGGGGAYWILNNLAGG